MSELIYLKLHLQQLIVSLLIELVIATDNFIDFLEKVIKSNDKKVFMIVDNLRVHHAKKVKDWEEENKDKIKLFYLPAYSPVFHGLPPRFELRV